MKICKQCKQKFKPKPDNPNAEYCTNKCWEEWWGIKKKK